MRRTSLPVVALGCALVACDVTIPLAVDALLSVDQMTVADVTWQRGLAGIAAILILRRPPSSEFRPVAPELFALRLLTAGATLLGWFGAIAFLSSPIASALLILDSCFLIAARYHVSRQRRSSLLLVAAAVVAYVARALLGEHVQLGRETMAGLGCAAVAVAARAASYSVWEKAMARGEREFILLLTPLLGGFGAGLFAAHRHITAPSAPQGARVAAVALVAVIAYWLANRLIARVGAMQTRIIELLQVPCIWFVHLLVLPSAKPDPVEAVAIALIGGAALAALREPRPTKE